MTALSGFLAIFGSEFVYWLRDVARGPLKPLARMTVLANNRMLSIFERGFMRKESFTWMNLAVVKKPLTAK